MLNNSMKLLLLKQKNKNVATKIENNKFEIEKKFEIQAKEIEKLRNPSKGQIFIHFIDTNNFNLYRFNGKEWLEI